MATEPRPVLADRDRITIVLNLSHEHHGDQPYGTQVIVSGLLDVIEQPYVRRVKVGEEWKPVDLGWIGDSAGTVLVENLEGKGLQFNPTDEERMEIAARIVEVSLSATGTESELIPPGRFYLGFPADARKLSIRCQHGAANCRITVLPR